MENCVMYRMSYFSFVLEGHQEETDYSGQADVQVCTNAGALRSSGSCQAVRQPEL